MSARESWFKMLACDFNTWPVEGCQACWKKIMDLCEDLQLWERDHKANCPARKGESCTCCWEDGPDPSEPNYLLKLRQRGF